MKILKNLIAAGIVFPIIVAIASAQSVTYERDVFIDDRARNLISPAVGFIRASGYRCDSLSTIRKWLTSPGVTVICNNYRYTYELYDKGGRWSLRVK